MRYFLHAANIIVIGALSCFTAAAQGIINGDFEQDKNVGWTRYSKLGDEIIGSGQFFASADISPAVNPHSGNTMCRLGGYSYNVNYITQDVTIPATTPVYLAAWYQDRAWNGSECAGLYVGAEVTLTIAGQKVLDEYLCNYNEVHNWTKICFDVSAAAGQRVTITFRADAANSVWSFLYLDDIQLTSNPTAVEDEAVQPAPFALAPCAPNPVLTGASIEFTLAHDGPAELSIFSADGRRLATPVQHWCAAGTHRATWNTEGAPAGLYFYRLRTSVGTETRRLIVAK